MKKKIITISIIVACFALSASIGVAASDRNITKKLGGVKGDTFSIDGRLNVTSLKVNKTSQFRGSISNPTGDVVFGDNVRIDGKVYRGKANDAQPFIVNDSMQVTGSLTIGGNPATVKKVYSGTIDITQPGDEITSTSPTVAGFSLTPSQSVSCNYQYHFKRVAVPEITTASLPDYRVNIKIDATHEAGYYPNVSGSWAGATNSVIDGAVYILYKFISTGCGSDTAYYYTTGEYQITVVY